MPKASTVRQTIARLPNEFRKAADRGVADSQYNLAILYARGIGVEHNFAEAYKWFSLAAKEGDKDAAKKRDDIAAHLDQQSLAAARSAIEQWAPLPQPADAAPNGAWDAPAVPRRRQSQSRATPRCPCPRPPSQTDGHSRGVPRRPTAPAFDARRRLRSAMGGVPRDAGREITLSAIKSARSSARMVCREAERE
jgi:Sel1 repeat